MQDFGKFLKILEEYLGNRLSCKQRAKVAEYLHLLAKWNRVYNLTSVTEPKGMVIRHIADSLSVASYLQGAQIIDVGTGAGLPGIPLAITEPNKSFVLLDSNGKKTRFLTQVTTVLGLKNVEVIHQRVERYMPDKCFDTVITRAFSSIRDMLHATKHLGCENGIFLAMKGKRPDDELAVLPNDWSIEFVTTLDVPGLDAERHLIGVKRRAGE